MFTFILYCGIRLIRGGQCSWIVNISRGRYFMGNWCVALYKYKTIHSLLNDFVGKGIPRNPRTLNPKDN